MPQFFLVQNSWVPGLEPRLILCQCGPARLDDLPYLWFNIILILERSHLPKLLGLMFFRGVRISWRVLFLVFDNEFFFTLKRPAPRDIINGLLEITDLIPQSLEVQSLWMQFSARTRPSEVMNNRSTVPKVPLSIPSTLPLRRRDRAILQRR